MWDRLKNLWGGRRVTLDLEDEFEANPIQPIAETPIPRAPDPIGEALEAVDSALARGDTTSALGRMRSLLMVSAGEPRVLTRAARAMEAVGEGEIGAIFDRAAEVRKAAPLIALAEIFLSLDDPSIAVALADGALMREPDSVPALEFAIYGLAAAEAHPEVLERLHGQVGNWPSRQLARTYGESAIAVRDWSSWDRVAATLADDPVARPLVAAAQRGKRFVASADSDIRDAVFIRYGTALLTPHAVTAALTATDIASLVTRAAIACRETAPADTRVGYVGPRGEIFARWLADTMQTTANPLSARLPNQPMIACIADASELDALLACKTYQTGPVLLFQALLDPALRGAPTPDVVGCLVSADVTLPMASLDAPRAADKMPPRLLLRSLVAEASPGDDGGVGAWVGPRRDYLSAVDPADAANRPPWTGVSVLAAPSALQAKDVAFEVRSAVDQKTRT